MIASDEVVETLPSSSLVPPTLVVSAPTLETAPVIFVRAEELRLRSKWLAEPSTAPLSVTAPAPAR